eukprot:TRINITY_DN43051_c0_g1_i1.p1 TRINITY_DN43051_c0_g1~~TRINITY_DN43051_c0_g1_i1.p1  ORF type:complete len:290 (+),score=46.85 TRINITY_DN43051_c0_g1_i1:33-872(+)
MTDFDDEEAMDEILRSQGLGAYCTRKGSCDGEEEKQQKAVQLRQTPVPDDSPRKACSGWDSDSEEEGVEGDVKVYRQGDRTAFMSFKTFDSAAMSSNVPNGCTIVLPPGKHHWPGGDLRCSIKGQPDGEVIIEGNAGCGYFFYVRNPNISITNVTLKGVARGRSHIYIDKMANVCISNVTFVGPYNHCIHLLHSTQVTITKCTLQQATQSCIYITDSSSKVTITDNRFEQTSSPLVACHNSSAIVVTNNSFNSDFTSVFTIHNASSDIEAESNTVQLVS